MIKSCQVRLLFVAMLALVAGPAPISQRQFARAIKDEIESWKKVAKAANIKPE